MSKTTAPDGLDARLDAALDRVEGALAVGDLDGATAVLEDVGARDAATREAVQALLCTVTGDSEGLMRHLTAALRLRPGQPRLLCLLAAGRALRGEVEAAEEPALAAVEIDDAARSWETLGAVLAAAGKWDQAEQAYRKALERDPARLPARLEYARTLGRLGLPAEMLDELAHAAELAPDDEEPLEAVVHGLLGDAAAAAAAHSEAGDERADGVGTVASAFELGRSVRATRDDLTARARLFLDIALLRLSALSGQSGTGAGTGERQDLDATPELTRVTEAAKKSAPEPRVAIATWLTAAGQHEAARTLLVDLDRDALDAVARGRVEHVSGDVEAARGATEAAVGHYEAALDADPRRWQSACNALQVLLGSDDPSATARMAGVLSRTDDRARRGHPPLLFNEALYHARAGRPDEARAGLQQVLRRVGPTHPLHGYAQEALDALGEQPRA